MSIKDAYFNLSIKFYEDNCKHDLFTFKKFSLDLF